MDRAALVTLRVGGLVQALDEPDAEVLERAARRIGSAQSLGGPTSHHQRPVPPVSLARSPQTAADVQRRARHERLGRNGNGTNPVTVTLTVKIGRAHV